LVIPNTVIGGGGQYPFKINAPTKYISLCTESSFDLITMVEDNEFSGFKMNYADFPNCSDNILF